MPAGTEAPHPGIQLPALFHRALDDLGMVGARSHLGVRTADDLEVLSRLGEAPLARQGTGARAVEVDTDDCVRELADVAVLISEFRRRLRDLVRRPAFVAVLPGHPSGVPVATRLHRVQPASVALEEGSLQLLGGVIARESTAQIGREAWPPLKGFPPIARRVIR